MKRCDILLIFIATMVAAGCSARDRVVGPIGPGAPSPADHKLAGSIGFAMGHPYSEIRARLLTLSWRPDHHWGHSGVHQILGYPSYPEILCGEGMDAVCTARLTKGAQAILLTINPAPDAITVVHVNRDDQGEP